MNTDTTQQSTAVTQTGEASPVVTGLFALAAAAVGLMLLVGEVIPPVVVFVIAFIGVGIGLRRSSARGLRIAALVLPILLVIANAPFAISDFSHPDSPAGFIPSAVIVVLAITTAVLAASLLRNRPSRPRAAWSVAGTVLLAGAVFSIVSASGVESVEAQPGDVEVIAASVAYPDEVTIPAGGAALHVVNEDPFHHSLVIEGEEIKLDLPGSSSARVEVDLAAGEYRFFCDVPGHETMTGTLVVAP